MLSIPARNANWWKNGSLLCVKRSTVSFYNEQKYDGTNQICGSSQSLVIVPMGQPCPLVNISFTAFTLEDHMVTLSNTNMSLPNMYASYNSTSPYSFYTYPVSKFAVSEYEFCEMDIDTGLDPSHSDFILLNIQRGCAFPGNYTALDSTPESNFYSNNANLQSLTSITGFPPPSNWDYNLGFSSLPSWTYKCRHTYNSKFSIPTAISQFNFNF